MANEQTVAVDETNAMLRAEGEAGFDKVFNEVVNATKETGNTGTTEETGNTGTTEEKGEGAGEQGEGTTQEEEEVKPDGGGEEKTEETPKEETGSTETEQKPKDDLDDIVPPRGASQKTLEGWNSLKEEVRKARTERDQVKSSLEPLQKQVEELSKAKGELPKEVQEEITELRNFKRLHDFSNDPELMKEFDEPLKKTKVLAEKILVKHFGKDAIQDKEGKALGTILDLVEKAGGLLGMDSSDYKVLEEKMGAADYELLKSYLVEMRRLQNAREQKAEDLKNNSTEYFAKKDEEVKTKTKEIQTSAETELRTIRDKITWAHLKEVSPKDPPGVKAEKEKHNAFVNDLYGKVAGNLKDTSVQGRVRQAVFSIIAEVYAKRNIELGNQITALTEQINKIKGASQISDKNSVNPSGGPKAQPKVEDSLNMDPGEAFDALYKAATK